MSYQNKLGIEKKEYESDKMIPYDIFIFISFLLMIIFFFFYNKLYIKKTNISIIELKNKKTNCYLEEKKLVYIYKFQTPVRNIYTYKAWPFYFQKEEVVLENRYIYPEKQEIFSLSKIMNENVTQSFFHRISKYDLFSY